jgi:gamma-glutamyltranspeptidase/glutathione hydrolase
MDSKEYIFQKRRWIGANRSDCIARNGMIVSKHPLIGEAGISIMRRGGNAIDAAIAAAFMDCVVEPAMNGIGGEGVMTIHLSSGENIVIDYVGRPAKKASPDMYELEETEESGWMGWTKVKNDENIIGYKAMTVPGTLAGLCKALENYGTMDLKTVMKPAIEVAEQGFLMDWWTADHIFRSMEKMWEFTEWRKLFLREGRYPYLPYVHGMSEPQYFANVELAKCLKDISENGMEVFYEGWISQAIVETIQKNGGIITSEDLEMYKPIIKEPLPVTYRDYEVVFDPTHSGTTMMEILNIIEGYDLKGMGYAKPQAIHYLAEAIGLSFADRFKYMGDPGFVDVPLKCLVSKNYAAELRDKILPDKAIEISYGDPWPYEPECTTALAVADKEGNMVCVNQTLVNAFGCGVVVPETGIVLNNAMYGLDPTHGKANSIDGRKRRIQNVCPTILLDEEEAFLALGAPGGRNIQVSVAQVISHVIDYDMSIQDAVDAPRITRETGTLFVDSRFPIEVKKVLEGMGHDLNWIDTELKSWGRPVAVLKNNDTNKLHGGVYSNFNSFVSMAVGY